MSSLYLRRRYFDRTLLEASFARGIVRDVPRHAIPPGGSYDLLDYLLDKPGVLYKRGGTDFQSAALTGENDLIGIAAPEYPGDPRKVAFASNGSATTVYDITTDTPGSPLDANAALLIENPPLYIDRLIVCDGNDSGHQPQKVYLDSGTLAIDDLAGSPPTAKYSCVHAGRLVLANTDDNPNYVYFSDPVDAEFDWDTTLGFIPVDEPVTGLASVQGVLIVFSRGGFQRILGDVPPGYGTSKSAITMSLQPGAQIGCMDARSIVHVENEVIVANEQGVWALTGAGARSLTTKPDATGIDTLWRSLIAGFAPALGAVVACGTDGTNLLVSVRRNFEDGPPQRDQMLCYLPTGAWGPLSEDCGANMYATAYAPTVELYSAVSDESDNRARKLSGIFTPSAANKRDANGNDIEPLWVSRILGEEAGVGMKHYDDAHLTYRLEADEGDSPTLEVKTAKGLEADGALTAIPESPLANTATLTRRRLTFSREAQGLTVQVQQNGSSARTELHLLELQVRPLDPGDGGG